jgi:amylosucrase
MSVLEVHPVHTGSVHLPARAIELLANANSERANLLRVRLEAELPVLCDRLSRLYDCTENFPKWLDQLLISAIETALARPNDLWALDLTREKNPNWHLNGMLGYCAYTDKFAGSLSGVTQRIAHLQDLGVTYLHLLPFLKPGTPPNDGGFAVASYDEVDPALGDLEDLKNLTHQLRSAGISLCSDFVLNHVSHEHQWAQKAFAGDAHYQSFFHWLSSEDEVVEFEKNLVQIFPNTAPGNFTFIARLNKWVWTTFYPYQWDLNYTQPAVFAEMTKSLLQLANHGVEAFRLDSTGFLWKRKGTNCMNQPEVHWLLQALRCLVNIAAPGVLLKAEAIMPTQELPPYFGLGNTPGKECHVAYHSSLMSASWVALAEENASLVKDVLHQTPSLPEGCAWMTYVRCHDDIGWNVLRPELDARGPNERARLLHASRFFSGETEQSYARGAAFQASDTHAVHGTNGMTAALVGLSSARTPEETQSAISRFLLLHGLSLFVGGLPLIYMGDEWGQDNTSAQVLATRKGQDGRELHRPLFDLQGYADRNNPETTAGQIFDGLRALVRTKRHSAGLQVNQALSIHASGHPALLLLQRGDRTLGVFNFSRQSIPFTLPPKWGKHFKCQNLLTQEVVDLATLHVPAYAAMWLDVS